MEDARDIDNFAPEDQMDMNFGRRSEEDRNDMYDDVEVMDIDDESRHEGAQHGVSLYGYAETSNSRYAQHRRRAACNICR